MDAKFLLLFTLNVSKEVMSKPSNVSKEVSEIYKELTWVTPVFKLMLDKAGNVTKLTEPTVDKAGKFKVDKMVKLCKLNCSVIAPREPAEKEAKEVALSMVKEP